MSKNPLAGCAAVVRQPVASGGADAHGEVDDDVLCRHVARKSAPPGRLPERRPTSRL